MELKLGVGIVCDPIIHRPVKTSLRGLETTYSNSFKTLKSFWILFSIFNVLFYIFWDQRILKFFFNCFLWAKRIFRFFNFQFFYETRMAVLLSSTEGLTDVPNLVDAVWRVWNLSRTGSQARLNPIINSPKLTHFSAFNVFFMWLMVWTFYVWFIFNWAGLSLLRE